MRLPVNTFFVLFPSPATEESQHRVAWSVAAHQGGFVPAPAIPLIHCLVQSENVCRSAYWEKSKSPPLRLHMPEFGGVVSGNPIVSVRLNRHLNSISALS